MMMILAVMISISTTTVFASEDVVSPWVLKAFKTEFVSAQEVDWTTGSTFYRAAFTINGQRVFAYYGIDGDFLGLTRYITSLQLPIGLQTSIKKYYADLWISDLFEISNNEGTSYYVTLEDADKKIILTSTNSINWKVFKKIKKA